MSRDDCENKGNLITPHIEIGEGCDPGPLDMLGMNTSTFAECLRHVVPENQRGDGEVYAVHGVVGRNVASPSGAYLNSTDPAVSRTLMGYLTMDVVRDKLPNVFSIFQKRKR